MFTRDQVLEYLLRIRFEGRLQAMMGLLGRDGQAEDFQKMDESIHETYKSIVEG